MTGVRLAALAAVLTVVCACTADTSRARPDGSTSAGSPTTTPALPFGGAPAVANPLPDLVLQGDPCVDALSHTQIRAIVGADVAGRPEGFDAVGPGCGWHNLDTGYDVGVTYVVEPGTGLSGFYTLEAKISQLRALPPIQGFPAITFPGNQEGASRRWWCEATVGLADQNAITVRLTLGPASRASSTDPCGPMLLEATAAVVDTLRAKAARR
ncbi:DUF3558 domain-containing protein [Amycolatopsis mediterranei]|uniref:DUF3558 domain-containing protein n=1 Tax=Amycolatopsis mediterranei TaxID=33910 RepID=UPI003415D71C